MPIKGKTEKLLDGHGKQLLQALLTAPSQAEATLRANEGPYPADEDEGRKRDPSVSFIISYV